MILLSFISSSLIFCCLEAAHSSHCILSLGWPKSLVHNWSNYWRPRWPPSYGELDYIFFKPRRSTVLWTPVAEPFRFSRWCCYFLNHSATCKIQENQYQRTCKDPISTVAEQSSKFFLQENDFVNSVPTLRTACRESCQVGPQQSEALRKQEIMRTWTIACPLRAKERWGSRRSSKMKNLQLKTSIDKDTTLNFPVPV